MFENSENKKSNAVSSFEKPESAKADSKPVISVIIPAYLEEKILDYTLSVYENNLRKKFNFELILSDGGSEDRTIEIAKKYADKIIEKKGEGRQTIAAGRNAGAKAAEGEVFVFINADTIPAEPEKFFEKIFEWSKGEGKFKDCVALTCVVEGFREEIKLKDKIFYFFHNRYVRFLNAIGVGMGRGECQIVKKEHFEAVGGYNEKLAAGEDFDLFKRLAKVGKIGFMKEVKVLESLRRFRRYGYARIIASWIYNALSVMLFGKSVSKEWEPTR